MSLQEREQTAEAGPTVKGLPVHVQQQQVWMHLQYEQV